MGRFVTVCYPVSSTAVLWCVIRDHVHLVPKQAWRPANAGPCRNCGLVRSLISSAERNAENLIRAATIIANRFSEPDKLGSNSINLKN